VGSILNVNHSVCFADFVDLRQMAGIPCEGHGRKHDVSVRMSVPYRGDLVFQFSGIDLGVVRIHIRIVQVRATHEEGVRCGEKSNGRTYGMGMWAGSVGQHGQIKGNRAI